MEGGGGGGGECSCRDNYNDREHKADEARGGGGQRAERKQSRDTTNAFERGVCVRAVFFLFFLFFFPRIPLRIRAKAALYFYVYLFRIGGASVLTRKRGKSNGCARSQRKGNKLVE